MAKYNMTFEESQEYISKRGFDIAWNDCDVFIDVRHITQAIGNILKWADEHPKEESVSEDLDEAAKADAMIERPDDTEVGYDLNRYGGFISGAQWREEQMMAKAVDGDITFDYYGDDDKTYGCIAHNSFCLEDFGLKDRNKVKVIIIKED